MKLTHMIMMSSICATFYFKSEHVWNYLIVRRIHLYRQGKRYPFKVSVFPILVFGQFNSYYSASASSPSSSRISFIAPSIDSICDGARSLGAICGCAPCESLSLAQSYVKVNGLSVKPRLTITETLYVLPVTGVHSVFMVLYRLKRESELEVECAPRAISFHSAV